MHQAIQQNFDIDLMIRAVHTSGVIDKVGIAGTPIERIFNAAPLGHTEIAALAEYTAAQFPAIDTNTIVGTIANILVTFPRRLHVTAYTTVPDQINRCFQQGIDQLAGFQCSLADIQRCPNFRGQLEQLCAAGKNPATG